MPPSELSTAVICVVHEDTTLFPLEFFVRAVKVNDLLPVTAGGDILPRKLCFFSCGGILLRAIVVEMYNDKTVQDLTGVLYGKEKLHGLMAKFHLDGMTGNGDVPPPVPPPAVAVTTTASIPTVSNSTGNTRPEDGTASDNDSFEEEPRPPVRPLIGRLSMGSPGVIRRRPVVSVLKKAVPNRLEQVLGGADARGRAPSLPRGQPDNSARIPPIATPSTSTPRAGFGVGQRDPRTRPRFMPYGRPLAPRDSRAQSADRAARESSVVSMEGHGGRSRSVVFNRGEVRLAASSSPSGRAPVPDVLRDVDGEDISSRALQATLFQAFPDDVPAEKAWKSSLRAGLKRMFSDEDLVTYGYTKRGRGGVTSDSGRAHLERLGHLCSVLCKVCEQRGIEVPGERALNLYLSGVVGNKRMSFRRSIIPQT